MRIWYKDTTFTLKFSLLDVTWQIYDKVFVVYGPRLFARKFARRNHWNISWSFGRFYGCRIPRLNVRLSSNMSDYSSMATLQNNSQTAKFAAALQRAKLVRETHLHIVYFCTSLFYHILFVFIPSLQSQLSWIHLLFGSTFYLLNRFVLN